MTVYQQGSGSPPYGCGPHGTRPDAMRYPGDPGRRTWMVPRPGLLYAMVADQALIFSGEVRWT